MATTNTQVKVTASAPAGNPASVGSLLLTVTDVQFDSSYPTGGEALTADDLGLKKVLFAVATVKTAGTGSVTQVHYDRANEKLKAYTAAAEVANTTDLSAVHAQVVAFGY